jgi:prepilin-type N-terminal cleavage/methylation domain-containing protein
MRRFKNGFTLVELTVVVVVIGVLAAFAVPKFLSSVERSKAAEAFSYLSTVQSAQERYHARQGEYAAALADLDIADQSLEYFVEADIDAADETTWTQTLTRDGAAAGYGAYTVVFTQDGFDAVNSTITDDINPMQTN